MSSYTRCQCLVHSDEAKPLINDFNVFSYQVYLPVASPISLRPKI